MSMNQYLFSIGTAMIVFPMIAFLFTLPYFIRQYRRFGSIPMLRIFIVYSFILYLLTIYFLVILPLPSIEEVRHYQTPIAQLIPFHFIIDFLRESGFVWNQVDTYLKAIQDPSFYGVLFNILMFIPLGFYLRYYFKCSLKRVLFVSLLVSLFLEITQLTGLYGIYPRPYRLFDVDDLIMNSLGGCVGYLVTPLLCLLLPSKDRLDEIAYQRGRTVTFTRRFVAFFCDWMFLIFLSSLLTHYFQLPFLFSFMTQFSWTHMMYYLVYIGTYFIIVPWLCKGKTLGKWIVRIKISSTDDKMITLSHYIVRYGLLYGLYVCFPFLWMSFIPFFTQHIFFFLFMICTLFSFCSFTVYFLGQILFLLFTKKNLLFYEKCSHSTNVSTIMCIDGEESAII